MQVRLSRYQYLRRCGIAGTPFFSTDMGRISSLKSYGLGEPTGASTFHRDRCLADAPQAIERKAQANGSIASFFENGIASRDASSQDEQQIFGFKSRAVGVAYRIPVATLSIGLSDA